MTTQPQVSTIHGLIDQQAKLTPDKIAVSFENDTLTYAQLKNYSSNLAAELTQKTVARGDLVGVFATPSLEMIIGITAVLKAGAAYLPLDPAYPKDRLLYMIQNSRLKLVIGTEDRPFWLPYDIIYYSLNKQALSCTVNDFAITGDSSDLMYVIYTSGSTGNPKGVMVEHQNVYYFREGIQPAIGFEKSQSILAVTTISFDISILELICSLTWGMEIVLAPKETQNSPQQLFELIKAKQIDIIQFTPSRLAAMLADDIYWACLTGVKKIIVGGERFPEALLYSLQAKTTAQIYNVYGPTETTIWVTVKELTTAKQVTIGKPFKHVKAYILDEQNNVVDNCEYGELCISGKTVSRGYLHLPEQTADKFISHPQNAGETIYKTGDVARILVDGEIEIAGRKDEQVKIQGYRIELGEIEALLRKYEAIKEVTVVVKENSEGMKSIYAYYVAREELAPFKLRQFLKQFLPNYMIPVRFNRLEKLLFTLNGKVDKVALAKLEHD
jgi:amino acid adenylation domain-containing protein